MGNTVIVVEDVVLVLIITLLVHNNKNGYNVSSLRCFANKTVENDNEKGSHSDSPDKQKPLNQDQEVVVEGPQGE